jgi:hypothetical protein
MMSNKLTNGDEQNEGFGAPEHIAQHKPGFDFTTEEHEVETGKDHRRKPKDPKDIPQIPLAKRLERARQGEK